MRLMLESGLAELRRRTISDCAKMEYSAFVCTGVRAFQAHRIRLPTYQSSTLGACMKPDGVCAVPVRFGGQIVQEA
jgi:hypothetical protein